MRPSRRIRDILNFRPFQGDETDTTELRDRMVMVRYSHRCQICWGRIEGGDYVRALTERNNETKQVMTFYFCELCCTAMAKSWSPKDAGRTIEHRYGIGQDRARVARRKGEAA